MEFREAVDYLLGLGYETLAIKLGLRNTELLLQALHNPERGFPSVQIAGTNGKGSTAVVLDSICRAAGIRTGLYTSPHLVSITERIKINGTSLSSEAFAASATTVRNAAQKLLATRQITALPTFFEQVTAIALVAFREARVDLAILETGLGGRLDSTTAANASIVAVTQIAFDHEEYLGNTLRQIAGEKAAIIRPGVKAVIAPQNPEALAVIMRQAEANGVTPIIDGCARKIAGVTADGHYEVTFETADDIYQGVKLGLAGRHQIDNVAVAIQLAELERAGGFNVSHAAIVKGIESAAHPGRLELFAGSPSFLLDGAHNPAGARTLRDYLNEFSPKPLTLVFGAMRDKRLDEIAQILFRVADHLVLTPINNPRAATTELLMSLTERRLASDKITAATSSTDALKIAERIMPAEGTVCVTGSLYLIGEVRPLVIGRGAAAR
jgi:dihydrofolate synthase / folylpolyglutamate synthase